MFNILHPSFLECASEHKTIAKTKYYKWMN